MANFYLALTDGTTTVNLTDQAKYILRQPDGFTPAIPNIVDGHYEDVIDTIVLNVIGATARAALANLRALTTMLEAAQNWVDYETQTPVTVLYTVPGSNPGRLLAAVVTGWNRTDYLPADYNDQIQRNKIIRDVKIALQHRAPWLHKAWTYDNLITATAGMTGWTGTGTTGPTVFSGTYGGTGYITATSTTGSAISKSLNLTITNGSTYTITATYAASAATSVDVYFDTGGISPVVTVAITPGGNIANGTTFTTNLTANTTGTAKLAISFNGAATDTLKLAEVSVVLGTSVVDVWHRTYSEETVSTTGTSISSAEVSSVEWTSNPVVYPSPVLLSLGNFTAPNTPTLNTGYLLISPSITGANITVHDIPNTSSKTTAPFATISTDTANNPLGGTITRYTPSSTSKVSTYTATRNIFTAGVAQWYGGIFAFLVARNNSTTTSFQVSVAYYYHSQPIETTQVTIDTSSTQPRVIPLGEIYNETGVLKYEIYIQASAASGTLDLDSIMFIRQQSAMYILKYDTYTNDTTGGALTIDPRALTGREPTVGSKEIINGVAVPRITTGYVGDGYIQTTGSQMAVCWFATYGASWRHIDAGVSSTTVSTATITATRTPAFVLPE